jgi:hypothetical protein
MGSLMMLPGLNKPIAAHHACPAELGPRLPTCCATSKPQQNVGETHEGRPCG